MNHTIQKFRDTSTHLLGAFAVLSAALTAAVIMTGCGQAPEKSVDAEFAPYLAKFEREAATSGKAAPTDRLVLKFGAMEKSTELGACELGPDALPTITIDAAHWEKLSEADREQLIFHELGHCVLARKHSLAVDSNGNPVSMMYPIAIEGPVYERLRDAYHVELFQE